MNSYVKSKKEKKIHILYIKIYVFKRTYGVNKRWYIHAIRSPVKLGAGDSGPLEILLFLKN